MFKYKTMFFSLVMLICFSTAFSQTPKFWITNIDNSGFPTIRVNYTALDVSNRKIESADLSMDDFDLFEDGVQVNDADVMLNCGILENDIPLSVVLALDVTESLVNNDNNINYLEWIQDASKVFIDSLDFDNGSEAHVIKWAGSGEPLGWSSNEGELLEQINDIDVKAGTTNFNSAFLNITGAIEQMKLAKENTRKVILFFTDGEHRFLEDPDSFEWEQIRDLCNQNGIEVYCIETNLAESNFRLDNLARSTGGEAFFVDTKEELSSLFVDFFNNLSSDKIERCFLEYQTSVPCADATNTREVKIEFSKFSPPFPITEDSKNYEVPLDKTKGITINRNKLYLSGNGEVSAGIELTAQNGDFNITGYTVTPDDGNISLSQDNFTISNNNMVAVDVIFDPTIVMTPQKYELQILSDECQVPPIEILTTCEAIVTESTIDLGAIPSGSMGSRFITIKNILDEPVSGTLAIENDPNAYFTLVTPNPFDLAPQEEKQVEISYDIAGVGSFSGDLTYEFETGCGPTVVSLVGEIATGEVAMSQFNFGNVRQGVATNGNVELTNSGDSPITINEIRFQDPAIAEFEFVNDVNASLPRELNSGESISLDVIFTPSAEANFTQGIVAVRESGDQDLFENVLIGVGTLPSIDANDFNFAQQAVANAEQGIITIENNNSSEELIIGEIRVKAGEDAEGNFSIISNYMNRAIPVDGELDIEIEFLPQSPGLKTATLEIVHNSEIGDTSIDEIFEVTVSGELLAPDRVAISVTALDFNTRTACNNHQENLVINNPNDEDITVTLQINDPNNVFSLLTAQEYILTATGNSFIPIVFAPNTSGNYTATIDILENGQLLATADLNGIAALNSLPIEINPLARNTFEIDSEFEMSFDLDVSSQNLNDNLFTFYIDYNAKQLFLDDNTMPQITNGVLIGNLEIAAQNVDFRRATINVELDANSTDISASLGFRTLLHNEDVSTLTVSAETKDCVEFDSDNISVSVDGCVNEHTGIATDGNYSFEDIYPNPVTTDFSINYAIAIEAHTLIEIFNSNGNVVKTVVDTVTPVGKYKATVPAGNLEGGVYFVRIETLTFTKTTKFILTK